MTVFADSERMYWFSNKNGSFHFNHATCNKKYIYCTYCTLFKGKIVVSWLKGKRKKSLKGEKQSSVISGSLLTSLHQFTNTLVIKLCHCLLYVVEKCSCYIFIVDGKGERCLSLPPEPVFSVTWPWRSSRRWMDGYWQHYYKLHYFWD